VEDVVIGIVAIAAGAVFLVAGYRAFRIVIPVWGFFVGFATGAGAVSALTGDALLAKPLGWIAGLLLALLFAAIAYLYYAIAVVLALSSLGFLLGSALMVGLGVTWSWLIILVSLIIAVAFALVAIATDFPRILLIVVSAVAGATAVVGGLMLFFGAVDSAELTRADVVDRVDDSVGWWLGYTVLVVAGVVAQSATRPPPTVDVRSSWE
jgi:hypothetical protein